ncbi:copper homeostasis protein CutC [uncultured Cellulomonas sp.]|uniref:copper homeostasis protein CutC n=1 Tax=uncultured Cellulomonas sp. TaxID=189682 RepID=UPI002605A120|nr:copper homeostasis protein CutC [uncultured Cellulomonas sp.]
MPTTDRADRSGARVPSGGRPVAVEIAVQDAAGARVALAAGADRVELCTALGLTGGLTPTTARVAQVVAVGLPVHVLVRPRPGGFVHDDEERRLVIAEVRDALAAGASGVVVGALTPGRRVDVPLVAQVVAAAVGADVTFHRAFDVVDDRARALDALADLGVVRVLTSGGAPAAGDAVPELRALVTHAAGRVQVMAGGGVHAAVAPDLVDAVHLSGRAVVPDRGPVGPGGGLDAGLEVTDERLVQAAVAQVRASTRS